MPESNTGSNPVLSLTAVISCYALKLHINLTRLLSDGYYIAEN